MDYLRVNWLSNFPKYIEHTVNLKKWDLMNNSQEEKLARFHNHVFGTDPSASFHSIKAEYLKLYGLRLG